MSYYASYASHHADQEEYERMKALELKRHESRPLFSVILGKEERSPFYVDSSLFTGTVCDRFVGTPSDNAFMAQGEH